NGEEKGTAQVRPMPRTAGRTTDGDLRMRGPGHVPHGPDVALAGDACLDGVAAVQGQGTTDDSPLTVDAGDAVADAQLHGPDRVGRFSTDSLSRRHPFIHPAVADVMARAARRRARERRRTTRFA